ncbi:hypothetical protein AB0M28_20115 [Streptomyces sp. NPDC051940]|uniref:ketopantoate reductase family protein n=1 Tax=Streptomyces sp. NPDC051940 TaxID=3155675 RepID=UPI003438904F
MKILMVGAGALGQVFGLWLAKGGATVSYLVKPGRGGWPEEGRTVFRLRSGRKPVVERLRPDRVLDDPADGKWDAVWLCVSSDALREPWVAGLRALVGTATIVTVGQDLHDRAILARTWPDEQIVQVVPSVLAYQAPLADEVPMAGIAYWLPPGAAPMVGGTDDRARPVIEALRAGGVRAKRETRAGTGELQAALQVPYVAALEAVGWSLPALRAGLRLPSLAAGEALAVVAALNGRKPPRTVAPPWLVGALLRLLPRLAPFDLPRYLEAHFTKVGAQTRQMLDGWINEGKSRGLQVDRLGELRQSLSAAAST